MYWLVTHRIRISLDSVMPRDLSVSVALSGVRSPLRCLVGPTDLAAWDILIRGRTTLLEVFFDLLSMGKGQEKKGGTRGVMLRYGWTAKS